ncbi:MAG: RloB family protein [Streptococcus mitis]|jgi:putative abortive phage resistance protein|uniref:Abortive phage resistance protein n=1 Tax=Streptococcus mitis TaxID=28037 RepID=A0A3R9QG98_STRMT|nr:RloB family protein [Streptococcus mitis]MDU6550446.1 RloB family protein [Streptococcus mitis]RSI85727.1 hypothetical protein D8853_06775 [Streptococcus mitis]RSI89664.1 hypothetical protein D8848_08170 [Streptococcus mitis]
MARDRQPKGKKLRKSIYVFTEGYTERNYFSILNKKYNRTATVKVSIHPTSKQGRCLLNHALGKISTLSNTEKRNLGGVYIIFDKDSLENDEIEGVLKDAKANNIDIGFSNSCFEVWLLAHFEKPNESHTKDRLYKKLEEYLDCEQYERNHKNDKELLTQLEDLVSIAMEKTSSMGNLCQKTIVYEPYTNIGSVIRRIYDQDIY